MPIDTDSLDSTLMIQNGSLEKKIPSRIFPWAQMIALSQLQESNTLHDMDSAWPSAKSRRSFCPLRSPA